MAWNYDLSPVEYLEQRIRYYNKRLKSLNKMANDHKYIKRFGIDAISNSIEHCYRRIRQFSEAIKKLNK